jgi:formylglycine-generating enzyme required for sulfatase activity
MSRQPIGSKVNDMDQFQIFISYAREDQKRVEQLYHRLVEAGFRPWLDREHILPGMKWGPTIRQALKRADFVLVCMSATSINKRGFLQKEIKQALEHAQEKLEDDVWLIPVRLDDCDMPDSLGDIQWVDLFKDEGWEQLLGALAYQLKRDGKQMPSPQQKRTAPRPDAQKPSREDRKRKSEPKSQPTTSLPANRAKPTSAPKQPKLTDLQVFEFTTVTLNARGEEIERRMGQAQQFVEDLGGDVKLEMVYVPGGKFVIGTNEGDDEKPPHEVTVSSFFIGKYQITQGQWRAIANMGAYKTADNRFTVDLYDLKPNPSNFKGNDRRPVESVSWNDSVKFCKRLSRMTGRKYRLPTETEWEYACRAGTTTPFAFGETITPDIVNYHGHHPYGKAPKGVYHGKPKPVGSLGVANSFGLFDMHGNVWEWCQDVWHDSYDGAPANGSAWLSGGDQSLRVLRGGSFDYYGWACRTDIRNRSSADDCDYVIGFRVVVSAIIA